jgi:hypothetical protein
MLLIGGALVVAAACASSQEWKTWRAHSAHFASADHLLFSARNDRDGVHPRVTRRDIISASAEDWWGQPITVRQDQILER